MPKALRRYGFSSLFPPLSTSTSVLRSSLALGSSSYFGDWVCVVISLSSCAILCSRALEPLGLVLSSVCGCEVVWILAPVGSDNLDISDIFIGLIYSHVATVLVDHLVNSDGPIDSGCAL
ncbi:unnamed protein product [Prunus armeniaca]